eukprot:1159660-Pelagomonas_calceolata.AAC.8
MVRQHAHGQLCFECIELEGGLRELCGAKCTPCCCGCCTQMVRQHAHGHLCFECTELEGGLRELCGAKCTPCCCSCCTQMREAWVSLCGAKCTRAAAATALKWSVQLIPENRGRCAHGTCVSGASTTRAIPQSSVQCGASCHLDGSALPFNGFHGDVVPLGHLDGSVALLDHLDGWNVHIACDLAACLPLKPGHAMEQSGRCGLYLLSHAHSTIFCGSTAGGCTHPAWHSSCSNSALQGPSESTEILIYPNPKPSKDEEKRDGKNVPAKGCEH